ncbi:MULTISPECIES: UPF0149 family protein [Oleiagrimonas]|jgi:uncharacterized protein|uniref:UPF0149 family protein n=1 Tax=Oleiagrimonas citrea TaxID=1665687 RepID=A0A846ZNY6_9GAMM|nr:MULTISPECIES: UPF0149 family protein [Oleiagrimonas]NKZ39377.1 UPF0149 family protein [Oleiagrimonas citrea]RAP59638.1 hypothetical protein BTJ49_03055 [Oleiagrimonas sp. MCCC 1A03011]
MNVTHAELETELARARVGVDASELHGSLTGFLCGGGTIESGRVLQALELDVEEEGARGQLDAHLQALCRDCRAALDDAQMGFEPLQPDAERPLTERAQALVSWCRGFLGGFGLASAQRKQDLSDDGNEILRDFGVIAGSELAVDGDEDDERSLMEVSEFVRVGALVLHAEVAGKRASGGAHPGKRVH